MRIGTDAGVGVLGSIVIVPGEFSVPIVGHRGDGQSLISIVVLSNESKLSFGAALAICPYKNRSAISDPVGRPAASSGQSDTFFSSHIRMPFHKGGISDSGDHRCRSVARQTGASIRGREAASRSSLCHRLIAALPMIKPTMEERLGWGIQQVLDGR